MDTAHILDEIQKMKQLRHSPLTLSDLALIIDLLVSSSHASSKKYKPLIAEISALNGQLHTLIDSQCLLLNKMEDASDILKSNNEDLRDIKEVLKTSANTILDILNKHRSDKSPEQVIEEVSEQCSFHDLVGQRINRIASNATDIQNSLSEIKVSIANPQCVITKKLKNSNENLMYGPAKLGKGLSQKDVDDLFGGKIGAKKS